MSAAVSNVKIIKPNNTKNERIKSDKYRYQELNDLIGDLVKMEKKYIEHSKAEVNDKLITTYMHPLIQATHIAFSDHLPLILTPDIIWYCVSNAVAIYINKYSEELRKYFVDHEGKKKITVAMQNRSGKEWDTVFKKFSGEIKKNTKNGIVDMLEANFTTTNTISKVASQIVVMDSMQKYFDYRCGIVCSIPEIRLAGIKEDWVAIKVRTNNLAKLIPKFKNWVNILNEIFGQFINVFDEKVDNQFWNSIYKYQSVSRYVVCGYETDYYINGWIISFFPFIKDGRENPNCFSDTSVSWNKTSDGEESKRGILQEEFVYHMNQVPFVLDDNGIESDMIFVAGLVGVDVDKDDSALTPIFGYAITHDKRKN